MTVLLVILSIIMLFLAVGYLLSAPRYKGPVTDHFNGKTFVNPDNKKAKGLPEVLKWATSRSRTPWIKNTHTHGPKPEASHEGLRITFVNHSTFLIQLDGLNILTDPIWSERASPFSWAGPRRWRDPGIRFEDLPKIDFILLSHNHYDHLDLAALKSLKALSNPKIFTALGVKIFLEENGLTNVEEMDWWDEMPFNAEIKIQSVPAQHFSARGMFDRDATLWCGFVIHHREGNVYFAGDTGYNENTFKTIGERSRPIRASIIPIGAYKPAWFMSPIHCSPEEAIKIHLDVRSETSVASHFGTFSLADDGEDEPVNHLKAELKRLEIPESKFLTLDEGTPHDF
jgi:L-ascorbate metabolism protein UlaG (beta-lactamase superfamily)